MAKLTRVIRASKKRRRKASAKVDLSYRATGDRLISKTERNRAFNKR